MTKVNFAGVGEGFAALEQGTYDAVLTSYDVKVSPNSGEPYVQLEFTLTDPEHNNRKAWKNCSLQPKALWVLKSTLVALGEEPEGEIDSIEDVLDQHIGDECRLELTVKEYDGELRNEVKRVKAYSI